jgi:hypothetical protein
MPRETTSTLQRPEEGLPPVHLWNPPFCGDLSIWIAGGGTWFYGRTPIGRPALVLAFRRPS